MAMRVSREEFLGIPTKAERREIAQKLREYASWKGAECLVCCEDWGEMVLNIFIGKCGESYRDNYEYLADLIEPEPERTCMLIKRIKYIEADFFDEVQEISYECSTCKKANWKDAEYCDGCGAKVIEVVDE